MSGCDYASGFYLRNDENPEAVYYHSHLEPYGGGLVQCRWFLWAGGASQPVELGNAVFREKGKYFKAVLELFYFKRAEMVD